MNETIQLLLENGEAIVAATLALFAAGWGLYKLVVKLTPNKTDDARAAEIEKVLVDVGLLPDPDTEQK